MIYFPQGDISKRSETAAANKTIEVNNTMEVVDFGTLSADMALTVSAGAGLKVGSRLTIKAKSDGTARNITFAGGVTSPTLAGVINKTKNQSFTYDGSTFVADAAAVQLD